MTFSLEDIRKRRDVAEKAARAAAAFHMHYRQPSIEYAVKSEKATDLVTAADREAEAAARAVIEAEFPGEACIGEEMGLTREQQAEILLGGCWLIDPLDGTFNFVHGFPDFSATVAFVEAGQPLAGATFAPALGELFSAGRGLGARLNGAPIHVSQRRGLKQAVVNFWPGPEEDDASGLLTDRVRRASLERRDFGGTAIVLAYLACGRYDIFYAGEHLMGPWDVAAGALLIEEAGGIVARRDGSPLSLPTTSMAAANDRENLDALLAFITHL